MEQQEQPTKYTKKQIILLYSFFFGWGIAAITIASKVFNILPNHFVVFCLLLSMGLALIYRLCNVFISRNIFPDNVYLKVEYQPFNEFEYTSRAASDYYNGIFPNRNL